MSRTALSVLVLGLLVPSVGRTEDAREKALASLRGSWVCIEQAGKKPTREHKLIVDKTGGYRMGGTSGESSDLAMLAGVEGTVRFDKTQSPPFIDIVGPKLTLRGLYKVEGERLDHHRRAGRDAADSLRQGRRNASRVSTRRGKGIVDGWPAHKLHFLSSPEPMFKAERGSSWPLASRVAGSRNAPV